MTYITFQTSKTDLIPQELSDQDLTRLFSRIAAAVGGDLQKIQIEKGANTLYLRALQKDGVTQHAALLESQAWFLDAGKIFAKSADRRAIRADIRMLWGQMFRNYIYTFDLSR